MRAVMLELAPTRPVARSAAMRPRSAFLPRPRPTSVASPWHRSLFLFPSPRPIGKQSCLVACLCSHSGWEQSWAWIRFWEQRKRAFSVAYATVPTVPTLARARVMRAHLCVYGPLSLLLGTREHLSLVFAIQRLALFPHLFPARLAVGTREQVSGSRPSSRPQRAWANKLGAGYGALRLVSAGAGEKFQGSIAAGELELGRICSCSTRRSDNGGNPPFLTGSDPHVGRVMLEGSAYVAENAGRSGACLKLGRLRQATATLRSRARAPRAPIARGRAWCGQPMDALAISFELRSGLIHDWSNTALKNRPQSPGQRLGPGEARFSNGRKVAGRWRNREAGKRAGVISPLALDARPHEAGEACTLGSDFQPVKRCAA